MAARLFCFVCVIFESLVVVAAVIFESCQKFFYFQHYKQLILFACFLFSFFFWAVVVKLAHSKNDNSMAMTTTITPAQTTSYIRHHQKQIHLYLWFCSLLNALLYCSFFFNLAWNKCQLNNLRFIHLYWHFHIHSRGEEKKIIKQKIAILLAALSIEIRKSHGFHQQIN